MGRVNFVWLRCEPKCCVAPALEEELLRVWKLTGNSSTSSSGQHQPRRGLNQTLRTVQCDLHGEVSSWPSLLLSGLWTLHQLQVRGLGPRDPAFLACAMTTAWSHEWYSIRGCESGKGCVVGGVPAFLFTGEFTLNHPVAHFLELEGIMRNKTLYCAVKCWDRH